MTRKEKKAGRLALRRIGQNIEARRVELDVSREELAGRMEVNVAEVALLESGEIHPGARTIKKLTGSLDCGLDTILDGVRWVLPSGSDPDGHFEVERRRR